MALYRSCTQEAKAKTYDFIALITDVDSVDLPGSVSQFCSVDQESKICSVSFSFLFSLLSFIGPKNNEIEGNLIHKDMQG